MSVFVAPRNCLTFTNRFCESKLPSIPVNIESPAMQMVPSGHLFGVSLDGKLFPCVTEVTEIGGFSIGFSGIAPLLFSFWIFRMMLCSDISQLL